MKMSDKLSARDLIKVWSAPDSSRLMAKQWSVRLPIHVAAKIAALADMYPNKSRSELISELLSTALEEIHDAFPKIQGDRAYDVEQYFAAERYEKHGNEYDSPIEVEELYYDEGPGQRFRELANQYTREFEQEAGIEDNKPAFSGEGIFPRKIYELGND